jgi:hypothetical protein
MNNLKKNKMIQNNNLFRANFTKIILKKLKIKFKKKKKKVFEATRKLLEKYQKVRIKF